MAVCNTQNKNLVKNLAVSEIRSTFAKRKIECGVEQR